MLLLAVMLLALCVLVPSPALMEEWTPDLSQLTKIPLDAPAGYGPDPACYLSDMAYEDPTISVKIETTRYCETPMFIARVKIADASQMRTMMAGNYGTQRTALGTTMAFATLAIGQLVHAMNMRSSHSLFRVGFHTNKYMVGAFFASLLLLLAVLLIPGVQTVFSLVPMGAAAWGTVAGLALAPLAVMEVYKLIRTVVKKRQ
jgi:hypothetical protein